MPRYKSLFTVTNVKKFARLNEKTQANRLLGLSLFFIPISIVGIIIILLLNDEIFKIFLFFPIMWLIAGIIMLLVAIDKYSRIKANEEELAIYNNMLINSNISQIDNFSGKQFEQFCKLLFEKYNYTAQTTKTSGDYGVDLVLYKDGVKSVAQCKRYNNKVSVSAVQEIVAGKTYYNAQKAFIITNSFFTQPAINLAVANGVELIDRKKLVEMIYEKKLKNEINCSQIELQEKPIKVETNYKTNYQQSIDFSTYAFKSKNKAVVEYSEQNYEKVIEIITDVESKAKENNDDLLTLHFFYQDMANLIYSMRNITDKAIEDCLFLCDKDIEILKRIKIDTPVSVTSITRKLIILEKQNKIEEAIDLCDFAIRNNFLDNKKPFSIRKAKLENKITNSKKGV